MKVKTLLERAKPELIAALNAQMDEYPGIANSVVDHLEGIFYVNQLQFGMWVDVRSLWMQATGVLSDSPWEMFEDAN
jgi:hypothetical protein